MKTGIRPHMEGWCLNHPPIRHEEDESCREWGPVGTMSGQMALMESRRAEEAAK